MADLRGAMAALQPFQGAAPAIEPSTLPMPASGSWMPQSMKDQVPGLLQMMAAQGPDPGMGDFRGGGGPRMNALPRNTSRAIGGRRRP